MSAHYSLHVLRIQDVIWKPKFHRKVPSLYVKVKLGDTTKKTQTIKKDSSLDWNEILTLSSSDTRSILNIQVRHDSLLRKDPCIGYINIALDDLLSKCANGETQLSITVPPKTASTALAGILYLRLEVTDDMTNVANDIKTAEQAVQRSGIMYSAEAAESAPVAAIKAVEQLSEESDLYESIGDLFSKLDVFVNVIDVLSQVHPYLNVAWQVTSALYKGVSNQFKSDKKIIDLVRATVEAFDFVRDIDSLPEKTRNLEQTIIRLLKQTTECCLFVQQYTSHKFLGRVLDLSSSSEKIDGFNQSLVDFRNSLHSGISLHTALVSARMSDKVDDLLLQQQQLLLQSRLHPDKMNAFNRPQCLPGTRVKIRDQIMHWMLSDTSQNVFWLHGVAGCGKSTVSTTIAEYFRGISRLGAFLFFERGKSEPASVIRTIAYKLASFDSSIMKHVLEAIKQDNDIAVASAATQFEKLLLEPLSAAAAAMQGPIIVVLDALDECGTVESRRNLMQLLHRELPKLPKNFRFLITSRREIDIGKALSSQSDFFLAVELDYTSESSQNDVLSYIRTEMHQIVREAVHVPDSWPWDANMILLAKAAGGLFIWGSTVVKLVDGDNPFRKLDDIVSNSRSLSGLDQLYDAVLKGSGISFDEGISKTRFSQVLGLILLSKDPLSDTAIDGILGFLPEESSSLILSRLQSVLIYTPEVPVHFFHTSFVDYLMSCEDSGKSWSVDISAQKSSIVTRCFDVMKKRLQFNIGDIESSYTPNDCILGLQDHAKEKIPSYLEYACLFWAQHLCDTPYSLPLLSELSDFMYTRLLYWLEVLSLLKKVNRASAVFLDTMKWTAAHDTEILTFLKDARQLVTRFTLPISQSTPHIYLSALPLTPNKSKVSSHYSKYVSSMVRVDRRGVERQSTLLKELKGHMSGVNSVAFSPDGTRIVSGSLDKTVRVWDAESGEVVSGPFEGHTDWIWSVAFSPDGTCIVSGSLDETVRVWDAKSGEIVSGPFEGHTSGVYSVVFSPDGTRIVSGSDDNTVRVWDAKSGEVVSGPFEGHTSGVNSVAFSPDGLRIVSGSYDETVRVWDAESGEVVYGPFEGHTSRVYSVAFSPDGTRIVSGSSDKTVRVWDAESGEVVSGPFEGHTSRVYSVAFSPDGTRIVSGSSDQTVRVWDAESGEIVSGPFEGHTGRVYSVAFSPDGTRIVSGSDDNTVKVCDAESGEVVSGPFEGHTSEVNSVAFSPDGLRIVSGSYDETVRVWDTERGEIVSGPFEGHTGGVNSVAFSPDGTRIVSGSYDETVRVWDVESGEVVSGPFEGHTGWIRSVAFSPDGTRIVSGSDDNTVRVWDAKSGEVVSGPFEGHTGEVNSVAFSPDGTRIVSGSYDETVRVWDVESGEVVSGHLKEFTSAISSAVTATDTHTFSNWTLAEDGWIVGKGNERFMWVPPDLRPILWRPQNTAVFSCKHSIRLDFTDAALGEQWQGCFKPAR